MKFKKLLVLIAVFSVLLALALFKKAQETKALQEEKKSSPAVFLVEDLASSRVTRVTIKRDAQGSDQVVLLKDAAGAWTAEKPFFCRINKGRMDTLLKDIAEMKGEVRSESKTILEDYKISDTQGWQVILSDAEGKALAHLFVSPLRVWGARNFVRANNSAKVLSTNTDLLASLGLYSQDAKLDVKSFTDLKINQWDSNRLARLEILENNKPPLILVKAEDPKDKSIKWAVEAPAPGGEADKSKVDGYVSSLVNWYASEAIDPAKEASIDFGPAGKPWIRATLNGDPGAEIKEIYLSQKPDGDKKFQIKLMPEKLFFNVPESALSSFRKDASSFLKDKADAKKT